MPPKRPPKLDRLSDAIRECLNTGHYRDTRHSRERRLEREVTLPEIVFVLRTGRNEKSRDRWDEFHQSWNYAIRGRTVDWRELRVIVSFDDHNMLIITAIEIAVR